MGIGPFRATSSITDTTNFGWANPDLDGALVNVANAFITAESWFLVTDTLLYRYTQGETMILAYNISSNPPFTGIDSMLQVNGNIVMTATT